MRTIQIVVIVANLACCVFNFSCILRLRKKTTELIAARKELDTMISHATQMMRSNVDAE
jgi:hypothetical protein